MSEEKKNDLDRVTLKNETLRKYFPKSTRQSKWKIPLSSCWKAGIKSAAFAGMMNHKCFCEIISDVIK